MKLVMSLISQKAIFQCLPGFGKVGPHNGHFINGTFVPRRCLLPPVQHPLGEQVAQLISMTSACRYFLWQKLLRVDFWFTCSLDLSNFLENGQRSIVGKLVVVKWAFSRGSNRAPQHLVHPHSKINICGKLQEIICSELKTIKNSNYFHSSKNDVNFANNELKLFYVYFGLICIKGINKVN